MIMPRVSVVLALGGLASSFLTPQRAPRRSVARPRAHASAVPRMGITVDFMEYTIGNQDGAAVPCPVTPTRPDHPPERFEITEEQRHILTRDGVVHIKNVLSPEWLEYLRANSEWQIEHPHIWASPGVASGLYDYIQRNVWTTNTGFYNFLAYGPLSHVLAQLGGALTGQDGPCDEVRITTDLLMVNPNKGFKWHQDNQNGPVSFDDALRWWVTMDDTPADHGAPVYLRGSQNNTSVGEDAVFVNLANGDLPDYPELLEFRPKAGDMIIWHPKTIHKIDGPESQDWEKRKRRVLGGTVALNAAKFYNKEKVEFADMGRHDLVHGDPLANPHFPRIWPSIEMSEFDARMGGAVGRSVPGFFRMWSALFSKKTRDQFMSFNKVYNNEEKPLEVADELEAEPRAQAATAGGGGGFELPKLEMPKLELPKLELPKFD